MTLVQFRWSRRPSQPTAEALRRVIGGVLARLEVANAEVHVLITGDDEMRDLNHRFRHKDEATDVLSFPDGDELPSGQLLLGQIVISLDTARRQARRIGHSELDELQELATAGLDRRFEYASKLAAQFGKNRDSVGETLGLWLDWWRDLLLVKAGCAGFVTNLDREEILVRHSGGYRLRDIRGFIEAIRRAMVQLEQNANARLVLEVLMLGVPNREERVKQPSA